MWSPEIWTRLTANFCEAHEAASGVRSVQLFQVGGAVRLKTEQWCAGATRKHGHPSGMCGERVAVFAAGAQHPGAVMRAVAIVSPSPKAIADGHAMRRVPPGSCRGGAPTGQLLRVILQVRDEAVMISKSAVNLMPFLLKRWTWVLPKDTTRSCP